MTYGVEGRGIDGGVDLVRASDGVRREERDNLEGAEVAGIGETRKDRGDAVLRLGDQAVDGRSSRVGATSEELELRCTL